MWRIRLATAALALSFAWICPSALALVPCELQYHGSVLAVTGAHLQQGAQQKVLTKVVNAWRIAQSGSPNSLTNAAQTVDQGRQLLQTGSFKDVSPEVIAKIDATLADFSACLRGAPALVTVPVTVRVFTAPDVPAGANIPLFVDSQQAGVTGANGTLTLNITEGEHAFTAIHYVDVGGTENATITAGSAVNVDIILRGGDYSTLAECAIDETVDNVLPRDFSSFTARLLDADGKTIKLKNIVMLRLLASGVMTDMTSSFTLKSTGELSAKDRDSLRALLIDKYGPYTLSIRGIDQQGAFYHGDVLFDLGRYHASITLQPPVAVTLENVPVRIDNQRDHFSFWAVSTGGSVAFPALLPEGPYILNVEFVAAGARYRIFDAFVLDADKSLSFTVTPAVAQGTAP